MENNELYSNGEDCEELKEILRKEIKGKISFSWNVYESIMGGSYNCTPSNNRNGYLENEKELVDFYYKFKKDGFLRIGVGDTWSFNPSIGHKLAALSNFYIVLAKNFGEPTLFYTTKEDEDEYLNLQWSFKYKDEDIQKFKNGTAFDGDEIEGLIIIGEQQEQTDGYQLRDTTKKLISNQLGLPFELLSLINENIEDFVKYKQIELNSFNDKQQTGKQYVLK